MKALIIEDEKEICDFLKANLKESGFSSDIALSGEKGIYLAFTNNYDIIIVDLVLPEIQGDEVCREIRKKNIHTPIIILSGQKEPQTKAFLLDIGADDYLTKPYSLAELLARIRALLRRPGKIKKSTLKLGNLYLNTRKCRVKRKGKNIKLTQKEFALLECLMENKGNVVSRGEILENVWDLHANPFSNTIESHIRSLRRKIGDTNKKPLIKTIYGRGYKIDTF